MNHLYTFIFVFISAFNFSFCQPLQLQFENYTTNEGLAGNEVYGVFKDSRNFLWVRTANGLSKFDGIAFQNFYYSAKDSNSLPANAVYSICELPGDLIFIGTANGLVIYNNRFNRFENWRVKQKELRPGSNAFVRALMTDREKNLWLCYSGIIDVYDSLFHFKFRYTDMEQGKKFKGKAIGHSDILYDYDGNMWIGSNNAGLICIEPRTLKSTVIVNPEYPDLKAQSITSLYVDKEKHEVWYSTFGLGLYCYNLKTKSTKHFKLNDKDLIRQTKINIHYSILPWDEYLICTSDNGLILFNRTNETYAVISTDRKNSLSLISDDIYSLLIDKERILWIATTNGLSKCNLNPKRFKYYSKEFRDKDNDAPVEINSFKLYNSDWILLGTIQEGLYAYNHKTFERKHYFVKNAKNYSDNFFARVFVDRNNIIWVSSFFGLRIYNLDNNKIEMPPRQFSELHSSSCIAFYHDSKNGYWMSYEGDPKLVHCYEDENGFHTDKFFYGDGSFPLQKINTIKEDSSSNIWISTAWSYGILKWDRNTKTFTRLPKVKSPEEYASDTYSDLLPVEQNNLWIVSNFHGLFLYNVATNQKINFTADDGLPSDKLISIYKHTDGKFWIASDRGITQFDPSVKKFKTFGLEDGLPDIDIASKFQYDPTSHLLYTRTAHHIIYFNPDSFQQAITSIADPAIYLRSMEINGSPVYDDYTSTMNLFTHQNNINFEFSTIDFLNAGKIKFEYMLNGLETKWTASDNRRFVTYANLNPGSYQLKVRKSTDNFNWSQPVIVSSFVIAVPFYLTWWFILSVAVVVAAAVFVVRDYRLRNRKAMREVRERISRDLHDDIGSTLNSISIYSEIAKLKNTEETQRDKFLETIGSSSRNMIEQMNDIVWTVNPMNDKFENILLRMRSFASELTDGKNIQLNFDVDENCKNISLEMNERKNFYLIFKEAVNNAMKYSSATEVKVKVKVKEQMLLLSVSDNGVGFDVYKQIEINHNHGGNGLRNMKARAGEIKGELKINSVFDKGTTVELRIKV